MEEDDFLDLFVQIVLAIKHCHDNKILHRNLKSTNVFLSKKGMVKLGDFGIAIELIHRKQLALRQMKIKPIVEPPEVINEQGYSAASDIW